MDAVLVSITGLSLALAVAMGVVLFRLLREERQRSDARVALLVAATAPPDVPADLAIAPAAAGAPDPTLDGPGVLFAADTAPSRWIPRLAAAAGVMVIAVGIGLLLTAGTEVPQEPRPPAGRGAPLELVGLTHTQSLDALEIRGLVHNPRGGLPLSGVVATAQLIGQDGRVLATGRSPIDYATLGPGDESGFAITVPVSGAVNRYRVGFRGADGGAIAHVDRRLDAPSARTARGARELPWDR
jgi:hypothetical protein